MKLFKNHKGFTLAELCVVMAVAAIAGTMVVSFMVYFTGQHAKIIRDAKRISETSEVQQTVNTWLKKYDSANYTISSPGNKLVAKNTSGTQVGVISFNSTGKKVEVDSTAKTSKFENIKSITFTALAGKNAVKVTVNYSNDEKQDLIYPLFSNITRNRRVENRS